MDYKHEPTQCFSMIAQYVSEMIHRKQGSRYQEYNNQRNQDPSITEAVDPAAATSMFD